MLNEILNALSRRLRELFPCAKIYSENIEQGFSGPCFYISVILHTVRQYIGMRAKHSYTFNLQYFPEGGKNQELNQAEDLLTELGDIQLADGRLLHTVCGDMERADGVLICPCQVSAVLVGYPQGEEMQGEAEVESKVRE